MNLDMYILEDGLKTLITSKGEACHSLPTPVSNMSFLKRSSEPLETERKTMVDILGFWGSQLVVPTMGTPDVWEKA